MSDKLIFGNRQSEKEHNFSGESVIKNNGRVFLPTNPPSRFSGEINFTMKIDPFLQNYITLKMHSSDKYTPTFLYIDGKQLGYAKCGDFEAINLGYGNFKPENYFYITTAIPLWYTKNKNEITLALRQGEPYDTIENPQGTFFEVVSSITPTFDLPENKTKITNKIPKAYTKGEIDRCVQNYIANQQSAFMRLFEKLKTGEKLSITKYKEEMRHFCMMLFEPYCPISDKTLAIELILKCINSYVEEYFEDPTRLLHNAHQSDWGGYYGELGQALYITEKLIDKDKMRAFLAKPFNSSLTRKEAWEICLKANFDFASSRQSYIYNQTYYTYEGAWKAMAGLGVIESKFYIGYEKCTRILKEALGISPWLGEHILYDKNGRELDLYHCLFNHDRNAEFTDDFKNIVCRGDAICGKDENGDFIRRKPYGENYYPLTHRAMSRENGYVGNYGETANYLPEWVYRTFNHGDYELSDLILKTALENINSRLYMRYESADDFNNRILRMEQGIDERNPTLCGKPAYGAIIDDKRTLGFASLKRHMEEHSDRYTSSEWDKYKLYAQKALDAVRQEHMDGHLENVIENLSENFNDFKCDKTIEDIFKGNITYFIPHSDRCCDTNFAFFDIDNLTLSLQDESTHIFAQINQRNRGYTGYGRAHIIKNGTHQLTQFSTDGVFTYNDKYIRTQNVNMDFINDSSGSNSFFRPPVPLDEFGSTPQALTGEEQPVTYQEGVGKVLRENFDVDTPYSGYPDIIWAKIDNYFIVCNTTRKSYKNEKTYTLPFKVNGEEITVTPFSYKIIKVDNSFKFPTSVKVLNALSHTKGVLLGWKASEGESYNIYRNGIFLANTKDTAYLDKSCDNGSDYTYTVTSVSKIGESHPSVKICAKAMVVPQLVGSPNENEPHFGQGDDYHAQDRCKITDSMYFSAQAVSGTMSITSHHSIMVRESFSESARYAYMAFENDKIIIRTRSMNTSYTFTREKLSPLYFEYDKGDFTKLEIIVEKDLHSVLFYAWNNEKKVLLRRDSLPFPCIYYMGTTEKNGNFILKEECIDTPFPIKNVSFEKEDDKITLFITKGLDNKYLSVESSMDNINYTKETDTLICQRFISTPKPYFRITPINRHGIQGESVIVKTI